MKLSTCPGEQVKYSGTFAGISAAALLAVTTAVEALYRDASRLIPTDIALWA
jgi:hypothetical protein